MAGTATKLRLRPPSHGRQARTANLHDYAYSDFHLRVVNCELRYTEVQSALEAGVDLSRVKRHPHYGVDSEGVEIVDLFA